jgi:hypothetical protein
VSGGGRRARDDGDSKGHSSGDPSRTSNTSNGGKAAAVQAGVQALWSTLSFHYARSALEVHVFGRCMRCEH